VVQEFWQKAASHDVSLLRTEWSLLLRTTQQRLPMFFSGLDNPPKLPLPVGISMVPLAHPNQPQTTSRSVQPFLQHTDRQIDHATCDICSNRPYRLLCVHAMPPKMVLCCTCRNAIKLSVIVFCRCCWRILQCCYNANCQ